MKLYALAYVRDPARSLAFYEKVFGVKRKFLADGNTYGELDTRAVAIGFVLQGQAESNLPLGFHANNPRGKPGAFEFGIEVPDLQVVWERAIAAGARPYAAPADKPWGQRIAYLRDPDGILVEVAQPIAGPQPG